ncbi:MAG: DUF1016 N-terminal domain-containing protein [Gallionella sp.]
MNKSNIQPVDTLYHEIRLCIEQAKNQVVAQVNQSLVLTYWQIGRMIQTEVSAQYGDFARF